MTKRVFLLFVMNFLVKPSPVQAGIAINLLSVPEKYIILKNPYQPSSRYAFVYIRAYVGSQMVHSLNRNAEIDPSTKESLDIYLDDRLIYTFGKQASERLISIIKFGWNHPETPSCPLVMLFIQHGLLDFGSPASLEDTGVSLLEDAVRGELIEPGDLVVVQSERDGVRHSGGLIYLGGGYFLSCESGASCFFFRHASHIDSEHRIYSRPANVCRVVRKNTSSGSGDSGYINPAHEVNVREVLLRSKAEIEKINHLSLPSYIK